MLSALRAAASSRSIVLASTLGMLFIEIKKRRPDDLESVDVGNFLSAMKLLDMLNSKK